jgi:hypothetical protein
VVAFSSVTLLHYEQTVLLACIDVSNLLFLKPVLQLRLAAVDIQEYENVLTLGSCVATEISKTCSNSIFRHLNSELSPTYK